jgi:formylglycine-generating enzyme required for sulfatase activity
MDGASLVYVPAGTFLMGWNYGDPGETTEHKVNLDAFWMDLTEVTNQMYAVCVSAGACTPPAETKSYKRAAYYGSPEFAAFPVVYVSWQQASDYCTWAGRRLPSEAEWEFAARGQDQRLFPWGKNEPVRELANYSLFNKDTTQVGLYPTGASPFGVLDMAGNVSEWVADWYIENYYSKSPQDNPAGPAEGMVKAFRGGSFANQADKIRTTRRGFDAPAYVNPSLGFRCAQDAP